MPHASPYAIVRAWQDAANKQDVMRLLELSAPQIEVIGPRGSGQGHSLLRDWMDRAGLTVTPLRAFVRGNIVLVAQHGVWRSPESGTVTGERNLAARFRVDGQQVVQFTRYDDLATALADAGLTEADEVPLG